MFGNDLQRVGGHLKMKSCPMGADVQEEDIEIWKVRSSVTKVRVGSLEM